MFKSTRHVLHLLSILNIALMVAATGVLALVLLRPEELTRHISSTELSSISAPLTAFLFALGAAHIIFRQLQAIVWATEKGAAFAPGNAGRLRWIGWALLAVQVASLLLAVLGARHDAASTDWFPDIAGWLAVLLAFVLARIFDQGAQMRDDLQLTV